MSCPQNILCYNTVYPFYKVEKFQNVSNCNDMEHGNFVIPLTRIETIKQKSLNIEEKTNSGITRKNMYKLF